MFFQQVANNEDVLYSRIRNYPESYSVREQIEMLWSIYQDIAPHRFLKKAQEYGSFHQRWWEMYCGVGLKRICHAVKTNIKDEGPDFEILYNGNKKCFIEAIAPKLGDTDDKLPPMIINGVSSLPEKEFLLRITSAISTKLKKYQEYINKEYVSKDDCLIIALSACNLSQYGSLMDFPVSAPLKVLQGYGDLYINISTGEEGIVKRNQIVKGTGAEVSANLFDLEEMKIISAILYSNTDLLNSPDEPEKTFLLIRNPNANIFIDDNIFKDKNLISIV